MVRWLTDLGRPDLATAGGKGANLGELVRAGLPVPPGFVISTAAYTEFVTVNGIGTEIIQLATSAHGHSSAADRIGELFRAGSIPDRLRGQIIDAYVDLAGDNLTV